jgi:2-oxoisovalerate dehydrogenase E1 component
MEEFFFPQPEWILDAIHERIVPLKGHQSKTDYSVEKSIRLNIEGV